MENVIHGMTKYHGREKNIDPLSKHISLHYHTCVTHYAAPLLVIHHLIALETRFQSVEKL